MCAGAIINARLNNVYFGAIDKNNGAYTVFNCDNAQNSYKINAVFQENSQCAEILSRFFKELRNKKSAKCNCNNNQ